MWLACLLACSRNGLPSRQNRLFNSERSTAKPGSARPIEAGANERSKETVTPRYRRVGKTNSPVWHALSSTLRSPEET